MRSRSHGLNAVTEQTGLLFGADYNPEQWPEETWPEDIRLMQQAGINLVTLGVFSWARLQPTEGTWNFGWLDRILALLEEGNIKVCLATPTASPPPWLGHRYPSTLPTDATGTTLWYGARNQFSPSSAVYRSAARQVTAALAERYGKHPAVVMWHVGNELGQISYDDEAAGAFRTWLLRRYGSLGNLNTAWGTTFWSQGYSTWEEILPPRTAPYLHNPTQVLDFKRFTSESLLKLFTEERDIIRQHSPDVPVTTNLMGFFRGADYFSFAGETDLIGNNWYTDPAQPQTWELGALTHDLCRGLAKGQPWLLMESAASAVNWRPHNSAKEPGALLVDSLSALARGSDGICFFQFRQSAFGAERFHSAVVPLAGEDTRVFREVAELGCRLQDLRLLAGAPAPSRIAVLFDWDSWWAAESPDCPTDRLGVLDQLQAYYRPLLRRGLYVEVVHPSAALDRFDLVLVPSLFLLKDEDAAALTSWVSQGGTAVVGPFSGLADSNGHLREGRFPSVLADLLGVSGEEWRPLADNVVLDFMELGPASRSVGTGQLPDALEASVWSEDLRLHGPGAAAVATFTSGPLARKPAVVRNVHGSGTAWYVGCDVPAAALGYIVGAALTEAGITSPVVGELPHDVELATRAGFYFLLNHSPEPRTVTLTEQSVDLLTGEAHGLHVSLDPYGALVLKHSFDHIENGN
ncbi:beta-galactosidase [Pseudarthrobacter sp. NamE5]|uniref:beta-galactosidase n=1 Tax=Pseudarthrobacter sp. NamE5 TaxID=2576839 RepID=UPI00110AF1F9|nr:beta-galactosidase [Pseudarthrobacter sp. NamE5]TLM82500.1 beta-galactosidase [Pseudarthrobacter sp. NamE5]